MTVPKLLPKSKKLANQRPLGTKYIHILLELMLTFIFREAVVSEAQQKEMMAKAYRRQEELKKLEENSEDDYLHSAWADSNQLKRHLTGMGDIKWGPR